MNIKTYNYDNIGEVLYEYEHESGLRAFVIPKKGYKKKFATFATHYGSMNNTFIDPDTNERVTVPDGIAHFLEHKLFEQKDGNVMEKFSKLGANPNAYTGFSETVYLFSCTDNFEDNFKTLLHYVQSPYLTNENVEAEKGIIAQEINMLKDSGGRTVFFNLLEALYKNSPVKIEIGGTVESIAKITPELLYKCYNKFYHPSNMMILVVGDVDYNDVFRIVDEKIHATKKETISRVYPKEPDEINKKLVEDKKHISRPIFLMGYKDNEVCANGRAKLKKEICIAILLDVMLGRSSKLYNDMYNAGVINGTFACDYTMEEDYAFSSIGGETDDPDKLKNILVEAIERFKKEGISEDDFMRVKRARVGSFMKMFESVEVTATVFIETYFKGAIVLDLYSVLEEITLDDVMYYLREHFRDDRMAVSIVYPSER